jgi:hypothetical protein
LIGRASPRDSYIVKVLSALLERPGQIVTREELRQLIWPEASFGDLDHAINLAITKLRGSPDRTILFAPEAINKLMFPRLRNTRRADRRDQFSSAAKMIVHF